MPARGLTNHKDFDKTFTEIRAHWIALGRFFPTTILTHSALLTPEKEDYL
jgi:hypothetical protein